MTVILPEKITLKMNEWIYSYFKNSVQNYKNHKFVIEKAKGQTRSTTSENVPLYYYLKKEEDIGFTDASINVTLQSL